MAHLPPRVSKRSRVPGIAAAIVAIHIRNSFETRAPGLPEKCHGSSRTSPRFSDRCDFAPLIKVYLSDPEGEHRYCPPEVTHAERPPVMGNPDPAEIYTSQVKRQDLTIRLSRRRLTRLTNASSKNGRIYGQRTVCTSPTTTSAGFTRLARHACYESGVDEPGVGTCSTTGVDTSSALALR